MVKIKKNKIKKKPFLIFLSNFFFISFIFSFLIKINFSFPLSLLFLNSFLWSNPSADQGILKGRLIISGAWALYPLVVRWSEEFQKIHPKVKIDVMAGGAGKGVADVLSGAAHLGMVSRELHREEILRGAVSFPVAKDAVVPVVSERNPYLKTLLSRGLSPEDLRKIWISGSTKKWSVLFPSPGSEPIHLYTRSDACGAAETWAAFLGGRQEDLKGTGVYGDPGIAEAVRRDPLGLGYNNLSFAFDPKTLLPIKGIVVIPLDLNSNGRVDPEENFMNHRDNLIKAIEQGRYPSPPARNLYLVIRGEALTDLVRAFLNYVLGEGQKLVSEAGYVQVSPLSLEEARKRLFKFEN